MSGSFIAKQIEEDLRREKYWKHKVVRRKCYQNGIKQCDKCMYRNICENVEVEQNTIK